MDGMDDVLERAQDGDTRAFRELFLATHESVFRYAAAAVPDGARAAAAVRDAYVDAWRGLHRLREADGLTRWLLKLCRRRVRRAARRQASPAGDLPAADWFRRGLAALPDAQRLVFVLREWEALGCEEIAARLHMRRSTVRRHLVRARDALLQARRGAPA